MSTRAKATGLTGALLIALTSVSGVMASSHREAPLIGGDPAADNTDLYAFVSPDDPTKLTIIANYIPLQQPGGGPNFHPFDDAVKYQIHIDNTGDGKDDVTYDFRFETKAKSGKKGVSTFLYNNGPITSVNDATSLVPQQIQGRARRPSTAARPSAMTSAPCRPTSARAARRTTRRSPPAASMRSRTAPRSSPVRATMRSSSISGRSSTSVAFARSTACT